MRGVGERVDLVEDDDLLRTVDDGLFLVFGAVLGSAGGIAVLAPRVGLLDAVVFLKQLVDGLLHDIILLLEVRVRDIHHVDQQIGFAHLVQRRFERLHEVVREFADKADGIRQQERQVVDCHLAHRRVEGGEEFVFGKHVGFAHQVHQRGFADVRIADECHAHHLPAVLALGSHLFVDALEILAQQGYTVVDDTFVRLDLRLTRTTVRATAATLTVEVTPHSCQSREHILQVRHLDLRLGVRGLCALQEDLQDKDRAIHDAHLQDLLDVTQLTRGEFVVEDNKLDGLCLAKLGGLIVVGDVVADLLEFAFAHVGRGVGVLEALCETLDRLDVVGVSQEREFVQVLACTVFRLLRSDDAD